MKIRITLTEEMLGTKPADPTVFSTYIGSLAPDGDKRKEEQETAEQREITGTTIFHCNETKRPIIWDYQIKGFFKDACGSLRRADDTLSKNLKAYKSVIDGVLFVAPRKIVLNLPEGSLMGVCERPLKADTAQGPRISLARSETVPAGTWFDFDLKLMAKSLDSLVREWLDYGALRGLGCWRNSGKGRFDWKQVE